MRKKCPHGVMMPSDMSESDENPFCSYCRPAIVKSIQALTIEWEADERMPECPVCLSKDFKYRDESSYDCPRCGMDETTIW